MPCICINTYTHIQTHIRYNARCRPRSLIPFFRPELPIAISSSSHTWNSDLPPFPNPTHRTYSLISHALNNNLPHASCVCVCVMCVSKPKRRRFCGLAVFLSTSQSNYETNTTRPAMPSNTRKNSAQHSIL